MTDSVRCPLDNSSLWLDFDWFWHADGGHHTVQYFACRGRVRHRFEAERLAEGEYRPVLDIPRQVAMWEEVKRG